MARRRKAIDELDDMLERQITAGLQIAADAPRSCPKCGEPTSTRDRYTNTRTCSNPACRYEYDGDILENMVFADIDGDKSRVQI